MHGVKSVINIGSTTNEESWTKEDNSNLSF